MAYVTHEQASYPQPTPQPPMGERAERDESGLASNRVCIRNRIFAEMCQCANAESNAQHRKPTAVKQQHINSLFSHGQRSS